MPGPASIQQTRLRAPILLTASAVFLSGFANVMLGPTLPYFTRTWHLSDASAGRLFLLQFGAGMVGAALSTLHLRAALIAGCLCLSAGLLLFPLGSYAAVSGGFIVAGLGIGLLLSAANVCVGQLWPQRRSSALAAMNVLWSAGALACAPTFAGLEALKLPGLFFLGLGALFGVVTLLLALALQADRKFATRPPAQPMAWQRQPVSSRKLQPLTVSVFLPVALLSVGVEHDLGGWLPTFADRLFGFSSHAAWVISAYWGGEIAARLLMPLLLVRLSELALYRSALCLLFFTDLLLLLLHPLGPAPLLAIAFFGGVAVAPLYPLCVAYLLARAGDSRRVGLLFASSSLGGALCGWATGALSTLTGSLRAGLVLPAVIAVALFAFSQKITQPVSTQAALS